jgi:hypothetical protein
MPTGPEYLQSAHELEKKAEDEQLLGQAHLDIARAQLHATYALIESVSEDSAGDDDDRDDDSENHESAAPQA